MPPSLWKYIYHGACTYLISLYHSISVCAHDRHIHARVHPQVHPPHIYIPTHTHIQKNRITTTPTYTTPVPESTPITRAHIHPDTCAP